MRSGTSPSTDPETRKQGLKPRASQRRISIEPMMWCWCQYAGAQTALPSRNGSMCSSPMTRSMRYVDVSSLIRPRNRGSPRK